MSRGHIICLKHLKRNCICTSPKKVELHHSFRVPADGKVNDWKEFLKWMVSLNNNYLKTEIGNHITGTQLENYYKKLIENK